MTLLAFTYDDYYCYGIKDSFRGLYKNEEEVFQLLRGTRYEHQNLETMDTETHALKQYRWKSFYIYREQNVLVSEKYPDGRVRYLKHRWDNMPEFEIFYDGPVRKYGNNTILFDAGYWDTNFLEHDEND